MEIRFRALRDHPRCRPLRSGLALAATVALTWACSGSGGVDPDSPPLPEVPAPLHDGWAVSSLAAQGMDPRPIAELSGRIRSGAFGSVHGLLIARHGILVFEEYFAPGHAAEVPHQLNSITKSVTSALVGVAAGRGLLEGPHQTMEELLPGYADVFTGNPEAGQISLRDHLTMTSGIEWAPGVGFQPESDTYHMDHSDDPIRFVLGKSVLREPGSGFQYCDGSSMLLSGVLAAATGMNPEAFAQEALFGPLGIIDYRWIKHANGLPEAHGGLWMRARDLAKIGQLFLERGRWNGEQVIPESWIGLSTRDWTATDEEYRYGFQWWLDRLNPAPGITPEANDIVMASGYGGQKLYIVPKLDLLVVFFGCDTRECPPETDFVPMYSLKQFIIPAIQG